MENELFKFLSRYITVTDEEMAMFVSMDLFKSFKKGHVLLSEGQVAQHYFFVLKGCVRTFYIKDGEEKTTEFYEEEETIAPESLQNGDPSKYNIVCEEDCTLLVAAPEMEETVFKTFPKFESLCLILSEKEVSKVRTRYDEFVTASPEERYLNLMQTRPQLLQRVPQYQIASFIGIKPESLSRIRKRLLEQTFRPAS